jgi:hypothetical protein
VPVRQQYVAAASGNYWFGALWNDCNNEIDAVYFDNNQDILSFS